MGAGCPGLRTAATTEDGGLWQGPRGGGVVHLEGRSSRDARTVRIGLFAYTSPAQALELIGQVKIVNMQCTYLVSFDCSVVVLAFVIY